MGRSLGIVAFIALALTVGIAHPRPRKDVCEAENIVKEHILYSIGQPNNWVCDTNFKLLDCCCIDGRCKEPILGIPGGSAGELIREIYAFVALVPEQDREKALEQIKDNFDDILNEFRKHAKLCGHTDEQYRIGCGYLNLLISEKDKFGIEDPELIEMLPDKLGPQDRYDRLAGKHEELGVLIIHNAPDGSTPKIQPFSDCHQFFVYHPDIEIMLRAKTSGFMLAKLEQVTQVQIDRNLFETELNALTAKHLAIALDALAKDKPIYDVYFTSKKEFIIKKHLKGAQKALF